MGNSIALALARRGMQMCVVGRNSDRLARTAEEIRRYSSVLAFRADLTVEGELDTLVCQLQSKPGRLDVLIHSAGIIRQNLMQDAEIRDFDLQYATNVRAPYLLTKKLLPLLLESSGQIVFINSSAGEVRVDRPHVGQYAAMKHAVTAFTDSLREEVNPKGIRVLSVFLGRTATPMQETVHRWEDKPYHPDKLIQPEDVARIVVDALTLSRTAEVTDIFLRPMVKLAA